MKRNLCVPLVIYQESLHDARSTKCKTPNSVTNALLDTVTDWHHDASHVQLNTLPNNTSCQKILFINVSTVYHSTHDRKVAFWAKKNLHFMVGSEHEPPHVIFWASMTSNSLNCLISSMDLLMPHLKLKCYGCG